MSDVNMNLNSYQYSELKMPESGSTVIVGMSGGVDSTLTAVLLKQAGCKVIGVTMSSWNNDMNLPSSAEGLRNSCYGPDEELDINACRTFCVQENIEYHVIDVREAYKKEVLEYFKQEYRAGRTPNPCIRCNPKVKFGALLDGVSALGIKFDYFCTGHYARLVRPDFKLSALFGESTSIITGSNPNVNLQPVVIEQAFDLSKDQAYFLYRIPSAVLEKVRFPLGSYTKKQVFKMAEDLHLVAAERAESQDFVPPEYFDVIFSDKPPVKGDIIDIDGKKLGEHRGIEYYTIGQRRGLGVSSPRPLYVYAIDAERNRVVLSDNEDLLVPGLIATDWVWPGDYAPSTSFKALVKIRLAAKPVSAFIEPIFSQDTGDRTGEYRILFEKPQRAVAPGQSAVLYLNGTILGGGIISRAIYE